jgi:hypothetical protein
MAKKKHATPKHLDYLFERHTISKSLYQDFWEGYWEEKRLRHSEQKYVDLFVSANQLELPFDRRTVTGSITFSRSAAQEQAKIIGGYVIRVTKSGRPSKRGRYYRAIKKRSKAVR